MSLRHESIPPLRTEPPRKVLLCVEPTPFNYISGYANRFQEMLKYLKQAGDDVSIFTADSDPNPPKSFLGFPILTHRGFGLPLYNQVTITFDLAGGIPKLLKSFRPDLLHVSTPSAMVIAATLWASIFKVPLVMSYHTDLVGYFKAYLKVPGAGKLAELLLKFFLSRADLVLCTSPQLKEEMIKLGITHVDVWQKGINTEVGTVVLFCQCCTFDNHSCVVHCRHSTLRSATRAPANFSRRVTSKRRCYFTSDVLAQRKSWSV